ncbi:hypothetical protein HDU98_008135 [Podochytrium sp. JEL0797]|nr:hypothetical protein HDU98_008135 [Podochytrium sp. JEL0797]
MIHFAPFALLLARSAAAQSSSGCYKLSSAPATSFTSDSMMPSDCTAVCGSNLALIGPTVNSEWNFICACVAVMPSSSVSNQCNLRCPGASIPSQAPMCGGWNNGNIVWNAYGSLPAAPQPQPPVQNPPVVATTAAAVPANPDPVPQVVAPQAQTTAPALGNTGTGNTGSGNSNNAGSVPDTTSRPGVAAVASSESPNATSSPDVPNSNSGNQVNGTTTSSGNSHAIPGPAAVGGTTDPSPGPLASNNPAPGQNSSALISGIVGAVVVLTVGFAAVVQRRRRQSNVVGIGAAKKLPDDHHTDEYRDQKNVIGLRRMSLDSIDSNGTTMIGSAPTALTTLASLLPHAPFRSPASKTTLNLLRFGSKSSLKQEAASPPLPPLTDVAAPVVAVPTAPFALGAMPTQLRDDLTKPVTPTPSSPALNMYSGLSRFSPQTSDLMRGSMMGSSSNSFSPFSKVSRSDGVSVAPSSMYMNGLGENLARDQRPDSGTVIFRPEALKAIQEKAATENQELDDVMASYSTL